MLTQCTETDKKHAGSLLRRTTAEQHKKCPTQKESLPLFCSCYAHQHIVARCSDDVHLGCDEDVFADGFFCVAVRRHITRTVGHFASACLLCYGI